MSNDHHPQMNSVRAMEMLQSGEGADCVIEVVQQEQQQNEDGQEKKVYFIL
jgi:hypothetical protein